MQGMAFSCTDMYTTNADIQLRARLSENAVDKPVLTASPEHVFSRHWLTASLELN
jgi:hypothetical protein